MLWVRRLVNRILKKEKFAGRVDVSFVSDKEMRRLNRKFRGKDRPTDVLSFSYGRSGMLGDVIISRRAAKKEAKRLVIHGLLHILGYDHGRKMERAEEIYQKF